MNFKHERGGAMNIGLLLKDQMEMGLKGNLYHFTQVSMAYNSNRIEGSQLTEDETRYIYETNTIGVGSKEKLINVDDIIETTNHFRLFDYMLENYDKPLNSDMIKQFHYILKRGTKDESKSWFKVGEYKLLENQVGGKDTVKPEDVDAAVENLLKQYNSKDITVEDIIAFHYEFENIHPFQDGNGRVGRMIMFKECLKHNIVPFIIDERHKAFYYRGLQEFKNQKGYLIDTCLSAQDNYSLVIEKFTKNMEIKKDKRKSKKR